jgi:hypothetical protein
MRKIIKLSTSAFLSLVAPLVASAQSFLPNIDMPHATIYDIIANLVKWALGIFGFIAIIGFIIGGIQYLISAGDEEMQKKAKKTFTYSIIGVIVGLSGLVIIYAVQSLLSANTTQF